MSSKSKEGGAVIIIGDLAIQDPKVCNGSKKGSRHKASSLSHFGFSLPTKFLLLLTF